MKEGRGPELISRPGRPAKRGCGSGLQIVRKKGNHIRLECPRVRRSIPQVTGACAVLATGSYFHRGSEGSADSYSKSTVRGLARAVTGMFSLVPES
jgi:hypothetical protein